jgi:RNA polymerase sigma-70 factor (ECF subfamily)
MDRPEAPDDEAVTQLARSVCNALAATLAELPPAERTVFVLHAVLGLPAAAIAPIVGRSPAAVHRLACEGAGRVRAASALGTTATQNRTTGARRAGRVER